MERSLPPDLPYGSVQLGKDGEYWTVTYWMPEVVVFVSDAHAPKPENYDED